MGQQINDLIQMGDAQTLYELMTEDDDWMVQLDAAEGLVRLGDIRGLDFLRSAQHSESREVRDVVREIFADPVIQMRRDELEAADRAALRNRKQAALKRLQAGGRVFQYRMVYLPAADIMDEDPEGEGFDIPELTDYGLDGWEVVNIISRRRQMLKDVVDDNMTGAYFLLKRELARGMDEKELE
jgi:hypothetical protein